jgi:hypothetical protein
LIKSCAKHQNLVIFDWDGYNLNQYNKYIKLGNGYNNFIYTPLKSLALSIYDYLYNRDNLVDSLNKEGILYDFSKFVVNNYSLDEEEDLFKKYILLTNSDNQEVMINNIIKKIFSTKSSSIELYTQEQYDNVTFNNVENGFMIKTTYVVNSNRNIIFNNLKDLDHNYFAVFYKINQDYNKIKFYFKEKSIDLSAVVEKPEDNTIYAMYDEENNKWSYVIKKDNKLYCNYDQNSKTYSKVINADNNYKLYDKSYISLIKFNEFSAVDKFKSNFNNGSGNKYMAIAHVSDKQLFNFLQNGL